jgi:hypothetical protein
MTKQSVVCGFFTLLVVISVFTFAFAQNPAGKAANGKCGGYYPMPVIAPPEGIDYKMRVVKPTESVKYTGIVINPCVTLEVKSLIATPTKPATPEVNPLIATPNKTEGEGRARPTIPAFQSLSLKTQTPKAPSETLKGYALPAGSPKQ